MHKKPLQRTKGVSLIEVLIGIIIVAIASIGTLNFFAYGRAGIGKAGNRRAALERARERLEQIMSSSISQLPNADGQLYWCTAGAPGPCTTWTLSGAPLKDDDVDVDDLSNLRMETSVQMLDDPAAGTDTLDVLEVSVKVWFMPNSTDDDNFHRVHVRTLRTLS